MLQELFSKESYHFISNNLQRLFMTDFFGCIYFFGVHRFYTAVTRVGVIVLYQVVYKFPFPLSPLLI